MQEENYWIICIGTILFILILTIYVNAAILDTQLWTRAVIDRLSDSGYNLKKLKRTEYRTVSKKFFESLPRLKFSITKIYRVENCCNETLFERNYRKLKEICENLEIKQLFHGTPIRNVTNICKNNFDTKKAKARGIFFAKYSSCAVNYSGKTIKRAVILADVLVGSCCVGPENAGEPEEPFDTRASKSRYVFVKYKENMFIPRYVI